MKIRAAALVVLALLTATPVSAQTVVDACAPAVGPFIVTSAKPLQATWLQAPTVPLSATDPTPVPYFTDGFSYQIDGAAKVDITPKPVGGAPCPSTAGANAGAIPYSFTIPSGTAKGSHNLTLIAWSFVRTLDAAGNVVVGTTRQEASIIVPFVATDPVYLGPPKAPVNVKIWKQ